jgi:tetratricopeptide (TPR) repeat protein
VRRALQKLRARLPSERPLTGVQLAAEGQSVVVHEDGARWQVESGQVLLAFDSGAAVASTDAPLDLLRKLDAATPDAGAPRPAARTEFHADVHPELVPASLDEIYEVACALDDTDPANAEAGYREVLDQNPEHADAHINLGRILHERGELGPAEDHYRRALAVRPQDPTATFNIGVVLEDQGRNTEALEAYQRAIGADPRNADAHYNAARLYDQLGDYGAALRHLRICRDLARQER